MALKRIKITEAQAFDLLLEAASLGDVYQKYYNQIPEEEFKQIVSADPTSGEDKMGKYSKWLLALYTGGNLKLEDLYKATQYLTIFNKYKRKLQRKDIGQYKSLPDLYKEIKPYEDNTQAASHNEEIRQIKEGAEKVYEDAMWLIVVPHTKDAAIFYGKGTQWCTAATESENYFDYYNKQGPLYININKKTGRKYQLHFETDSFMDENDSPIVPARSGGDFELSEGALNFYRSIYGNETRYLQLEDTCPVKNSDDLYTAASSASLYRIINGVPQELATACNGVGTEEDIDYFKIVARFLHELVLNRYIFVQQWGYTSKTIKNIFDVRKEEFVFEPGEIRNMDSITNDNRYISVLKTFTGECKIYDLKVGDWLDALSGDYRCLEPLTNGFSKLYKDGLVLISQRDENGNENGEVCVLDLDKDKIISNFYKEYGHYPTTLYDEYSEYRFSLLYLFHQPNVFDDCDVVLYDGTIIPYNEYRYSYKEYFDKLLSEKNMTINDLWFLNRYGY